MRPELGFGLVALGVGAFALALGACKKDEPPAYPAQVQPSTPYYGATAPNPGAPGGVPQPQAPTPMVRPALGLPCASDLDMQCPFGRCIAGRCGGCASATDCKSYAQCWPTWIGNACLPGSAAAPAPAPTLSPTSSPAPTPSPLPQAPNAPATTSDPFQNARALCLTRVNDYRARTGLPPLTRNQPAESCADSQAASDGQAGVAHGAFMRCRESAQNECPHWSGTLEDVVERCLAMMFAEGPGSGAAHGHYVNMTDPNYHSLSCGISATAGNIWMVQDFYR
ncbi:MAG TPA: CAP domain-containing protein [Polyangiaceae bacterium]